MIDVFKAGDIARVISEDPQNTQPPMIVIRQDNTAGITVCDYNGLERHYDTEDLEHITEEEVRDRIEIIQDKIENLTKVIDDATSQINEMIRKI